MHEIVKNYKRVGGPKDCAIKVDIMKVFCGQMGLFDDVTKEDGVSRELHELDLDMHFNPFFLGQLKWVFGGEFQIFKRS